VLRGEKPHSESLRDGRVVYIGGDRVDDVTRHSAFCHAAETVAALYDMKADPANGDLMSYEEDGGRHSIYFLRARYRDNLERRVLGHRRIVDFTYGMFGRSPDHVASFITDMAMKPDALKVL
jgi:4-hydroxyphenylacetate 3-monooxygenase